MTKVGLKSVITQTSFFAGWFTSKSDLDELVLDIEIKEKSFALVKESGSLYLYVWDRDGNEWVLTSGNNIQDASTTAKGIIELATQTEVNTGIDTVRAVTPFTLQQKFNSFTPSIPDATETVKGKAELSTQSETDAGNNDTTIITPLKLANSSRIVSAIGVGLTPTNGNQLTGTLKQGAIVHNIVIEQQPTYPEGVSISSVLTYNSSNLQRTYSILKDRYSNDIYIQSYDTTGVGQGWVRINAPNASTTERGIIEQATDAETITGTDTERAVSPANLQAKLNALILSATAALDFPTIAAGETERLTATVTGAALLDPVVVSGPADIYDSNNSTIDAWVSAANTVTVRVRNNGASSIDPGEGQFKIKVFK